MQKSQIRKLEGALERIADWFTRADQTNVAAYVDKLRSQNPEINNYDLARKIVWRKSLKNGLVGAVMSFGGLVTLPITIPADLAASWKIQVTMALSIAHVYGHDQSTTDLKTDVYLILAGDAAKEALKRMGIEVSKAITKKAVERFITKEVMKNIWKVVGRKIITKAGEKSLTSFTKMVPVVAMIPGFFFDYGAARIVGHFAIKYYSGKG